VKANLESVETRFGQSRVIMHCDAGVVPEAKTFMATLVERMRHGLALRDGMVWPLGWSHFILRKNGDDYIANEPNYATNPVFALRQDCTTTLAVHREMVAFAALNGASPMFAKFPDRIVVRQGWAHQTALTAERTDNSVESGWRIDFPNATSETGVIKVYDLLGVRPSLLRVLALPRGSTVTVNHDDAVATLPS
jgi:hypothetical protein